MAKECGGKNIAGDRWGTTPAGCRPLLRAVPPHIGMAEDHETAGELPAFSRLATGHRASVADFKTRSPWR
jgi:hypothetical protein